jgi:hypothetical protein
MSDMSVFPLRRAIERLRSGLSDSVAVDRLTIEEKEVKQLFFDGLNALEQGKPGPLCICGSYGQGKSHTLAWLHRLALSLGYATSFVQLDLREISFHRFSVIYRSLIERLSIPGGEPFTALWKRWGTQHSLKILDDMPHRFRMILTAMLCEDKAAPRKQKSRKGRPNDQPEEFSCWLEKAFTGHNVPPARLRNILKIRNGEDCQKESITCRKNLLYFQMVQALGKILREMGYKGLVLFFDEAESIAQGCLKSRVKSYEILDQFFQNKGFLYPLFAFTDDFFDQVQRERYDDEKQPFPKNYAESWKDLNLVRLQQSSSARWEVLQDRLIQLYAEAYRLDVSQQMAGIKERLQKLLDKFQTQETRFKLKALVNQLDIETQLL